SVVPVNAGSFNVAATATNTNTAMAVSSYKRIYNAGPNIVHIRIGASAQTATTTDFSIDPGTAVNIASGANNNIAMICAATETAAVTVSSFN
ncbi:MAG TPA: hypothetical protein VFS68_11595, partial [Candidatus Udaeobacter sp.]|nr:hypothetical protein [Candidatus Udaeobacter sp.]